MSSLDWTLYEGFFKDFKHIPQIKALCALKLRLINTLLTKEQRINSFKHIKKLKYLRNIQINCPHLNRNTHETINFLFASLKHCSNLAAVQLNLSYSHDLISQKLLASLFRTLRGWKIPHEPQFGFFSMYFGRKRCNWWS